MVPSDYCNGPDREVSQCKRCTERVGPIGSMGGNESTHGVNQESRIYEWASD